MAADIVDVERAGAVGDQIRPLQPVRGLREGVARTEYDAIALAQLTEQCRQGDCRTDCAAAVATAFEPVARRQYQRRGFGEPAREGPDVILLQTADLSRSVRWPLPGEL